MARDESMTEGAEVYELQCLECFAIFESDDPPARARCESCGEANAVSW